MNTEKLLQTMKAALFDPKTRSEFYQFLISALATEAEINYPGRLRPGKEYDEAIRNLSTIVQAKGKIHAFYNLNCRLGVVPGGQVDSSGAGDVEFFEKLFQGLDSNKPIQNRIYEIIGNLLEQIWTYSSR